MKSKSWSGSVLSKGPLTISRQTSLSIPVSDRAKKDFRPPKRSSKLIILTIIIITSYRTRQ